MLVHGAGPLSLPEPREWRQALLTLGCQLAAVGPRRHEDWLVDAAAVLQFRTRDPRGWLPDDHTRWPERSRSSPYYPFDRLEPHHLDHHLELLTHEAAVELTALHWTAAPFGGPRPPGESGPVRRRRLWSAARTLLARFGPDAEYATNAEDLSGGTDPHWYRDGFSLSCFAGVDAQRDGYVSDFGILAVSDTEIGAFWNFFID
ncbi:hypothetical protein G3260_005370 [Streptomyces albus]|uniref:hypothetical protein n=1 Tax=Streptomyces TaxID=1883 RepID=UPI0013B479A0|nr:MULTISPECIES: hypothetical protein [Streptomyces]QID38675.1 hypothetical protein G3260_005370 [Streptomyces albus]